ncbi:hypothetical protein M2451_003353 [Dysgonomonas sp. PFB1-18]|uniref:hypothetical protein n=1 Tax=unclassified Dysgonomonas TaxID=2630389 RepID=UPI00247709B8|nr:MULTISPECIES: hypothetical protein [unclassified Dysgonomonas]MDH6310557.1 hypothetical protein [Dysgonomonas sp. PF1-14]MDH6340407.1 hypothetical protein [Dysgonomonas sp. PF1-16]MDH6382013.1 hypothetical protein [Dysgonomonas sp. PFB1-18]MDH6399378.1 hypothetical protein [Dysgonomonas sp. PF1-23]
MKRISFDTNKLYNCENGAIKQAVVYDGMSGEDFVFIPYDPTTKHYCGAPCTLSEKEVTRMIKPYKN